MATAYGLCPCARSSRFFLVAHIAASSLGSCARSCSVLRAAPIAACGLCLCARSSKVLLTTGIGARLPADRGEASPIGPSSFAGPIPPRINMRWLYRLSGPAAGPLGWHPLRYKPAVVAREERNWCSYRHRALGMDSPPYPVPMGGVLAGGGARAALVPVLLVADTWF